MICRLLQFLKRILQTLLRVNARSYTIDNARLIKELAKGKNDSNS
jgi:hypothetical protein